MENFNPGDGLDEGLASIADHAGESLRDTLRAAVIYFLNNGADGFIPTRLRVPLSDRAAEENVLENIGRQALFCPGRLSPEGQEAFRRAPFQLVDK